MVPHNFRKVAEGRRQHTEEGKLTQGVEAASPSPRVSDRKRSTLSRQVFCFVLFVVIVAVLFIF